ncbi:MAG: hypothetical protein LUC60_02945 [Lachnospiraceae bacterium]|nr:hypothetical protein [Lachnospiraceae bacterium]
MTERTDRFDLQNGNIFFRNNRATASTHTIATKDNSDKLPTNSTAKAMPEIRNGIFTARFTGFGFFKLFIYYTGPGTLRLPAFFA